MNLQILDINGHRARRVLAGMYLRKQGRRIYLLQSYRDGQGKVRQRRLGHFSDLSGWNRQQAELPLRCPELRKDLDKLRERAELMLESQPSTPQPQARVKALRGLIRTLLTRLAEEEDEEVLADLGADLQLLKARVSQSDPDELRAEAAQQIQQGDLEGAEANLDKLVLVSRATLPVRRQTFDPSDPKARTYLEALDRLGEVFVEQQKWQEAVEVLEERVSSCPSPAARLLYGSLLQRLGRRQEAMEQYSRLPNSDPDRHYNLASVYWQEGRHEEAMIHVLRGFTWSLKPVQDLQRIQQGKPPLWDGEYWHRYGGFWDDSGREFILAIAAQTWVRRRLRMVREQGTRVRELISAHSRVWLLQRGLKAAGVGQGA